MAIVATISVRAPNPFATPKKIYRNCKQVIIIVGYRTDEGLTSKIWFRFDRTPWWNRYIEATQASGVVWWVNVTIWVTYQRRQLDKRLLSTVGKQHRLPNAKNARSDCLGWTNIWYMNRLLTITPNSNQLDLNLTKSRTARISHWRSSLDFAHRYTADAQSRFVSWLT